MTLGATKAQLGPTFEMLLVDTKAQIKHTLTPEMPLATKGTAWTYLSYKQCCGTGTGGTVTF
jgi:hypothetical protein